MARERMVTRTVNVYDATVMCVEVATSTVYDKNFILTGDVPETPDKALKALKKLYETDEVKLVAIKSATEREEIYGLSEIEFLRYAKRLDENRKVI